MPSGANSVVVDRLRQVRPKLVDLRRAGDVLPDLDDRTLLHAGPPLASLDDAIPVLRGAIVGTLLAQGRAAGPEEAWALLTRGEVRLASANDHGACATFAAVISSDTPVFVVEDAGSRTMGAAAINEGRGRALRYGSNDADIIGRLRWLESDFAEIVAAGIRLIDGWDVFAAMAQALHMGDECHSRQKAASALFCGALLRALFDTDLSRRDLRPVAEFLLQNDFFFLPLAMAAAKAALRAGEGVEGASVVTCMCANGKEFGIQVSGAPGKWYTAPVPPIRGKYFAGFDASDAGPVIGDSEIVETLGLGALSMAAAPAFAAYAGCSVSEVVAQAGRYYAIAVSEHEIFTVPSLEFRGAPLGLDCRKVVETKLEPIFSTGIAHAECRVGQIGAGVGTAPRACFAAAAEELQGREFTGHAVSPAHSRRSAN